MAKTISKCVVAVAVCGAMLATICASVGCEAKPVPGKVGTSLQHQTKVVAKDFVLYDRMRVANHKASRTDTGLLEVKLGLENVQQEDVWCDIQVVFYDHDRFELEKTNWQPLLLLGKQITYYRTVSLNSRAGDYTVFLRNPRQLKGVN